MENIKSNLLEIDTLNERFQDSEAEEIVSFALAHNKPFGNACLVSSFGAESVVLLNMIAQKDPSTPIIFIDTLKIFGETNRYIEKLREKFHLTNVIRIKPIQGELNSEDPKGILWASLPDKCCYIRKVKPFQKALKNYSCWISGRKGFQSSTRRGIPYFELVDEKIKVNPLINWSKQEIDDYINNNDLPRHPLEAEGFLSIGCMPCTDRVEPGADPRSGRWKGSSKSECGIHLSVDKAKKTVRT